MCFAAISLHPEPVGDDDIARWRGSVAEELVATLAMLENAAADLPEPEREQAAALLAEGERLRGLVAGAGGHVEALKTRFHGDYHLGQVLVAEDDFVIIDFEGEPARSLDERRAKHSALKDVAGMLRSFDYAARTALAAVVDRRPEELAVLGPLAEAWRAQAEDAFLGGYLEAIEGCDACPREPAERDALLALFTLEKALYELRYELGNRPAWVGVPTTVQSARPIGLRATTEGPGGSHHPGARWLESRPCPS